MSRLWAIAYKELLQLLREDARSWRVEATRLLLLLLLLLRAHHRLQNRRQHRL